MLNSEWEGDSDIKLKRHVGVSLEPIMHKVIEIDTGKEVEKQILTQKSQVLVQQRNLIDNHKDSLSLINDVQNSVKKRSSSKKKKCMSSV